MIKERVIRKDIKKEMMNFKEFQEQMNILQLEIKKMKILVRQENSDEPMSQERMKEYYSVVL
ncbi:MAG: hypothetical protein EZS28_036551, partial [Streblomastix strix]